MPILDKFLGLKNTVSSERLAPGDLEAAVNIYLDDTGRAARRDGLTEVLAGASHSLWSDKDVCLFAQGSSLKRLLYDGSAVTVRSDMGGGRVSYHRIGDSVFYSDGVVTGEYTLGENHEWGLLPPEMPGIGITSGNLPAGRYGYTATVSRGDGLESGAKAVGVVELSSTGGITFDAPSTDYPYVSFYMTPTNGDVYYFAGMVAAGDSLTVTEVGSLGRQLAGISCGPPPAGHIVSSYRGRALVANNEWVHYSEPFMYHLFKVFGYFPAGGRVTIIAPVNDGIFVATQNKTLFLHGATPEEFVVKEVADYGAIEGSLVTVTSTEFPWLNDVAPQTVAIWSSPEGICLAGDGGLFINMTKSRYRFDAVSKNGASSIMQMGSAMQLITSIE